MRRHAAVSRALHKPARALHAVHCAALRCAALSGQCARAFAAGWLASAPRVRGWRVRGWRVRGWRVRPPAPDSGRRCVGAGGRHSGPHTQT
eukprot:CAMPEP_0119409596 /NCGR_PEP_ID=MMETSP1335-20130426/2847_1 /TAXON_ID=259385 /ORGANISM="Chrysoculter rhomboideus, Strain RCC1486" /LENGTH=90 /DNA_ID=CAMNT_0007433993 /DNA_START=468 /DNA_END=737 /DNA_ORIENTATION=-